MKMKLLMTAIASVAALSATSANAQDICSNEYVADVVYYATGQSQSQKLNELVDRIQNVVNSCDVESIQIDSHTDASGGDAANQALSQRRAEALRSKLIAKGIDGNIIVATGYGEQQADFTTADQARRSDVRIKTRQVVTYSEPVQSYTETVVTEAPYEAPTPIEPTTVTTQAPYRAPTPITTSGVSAPTTGTVSVPVSSPPPLPPVSAGGGFLGGVSPVVLVGGLAAVAAAGIIVLDDDDDDDDDLPVSP